jgi:hypothetical protein
MCYLQKPPSPFVWRKDNECERQPFPSRKVPAQFTGSCPYLELMNHSGIGYQLNADSDKNKPDAKSRKLRKVKFI